jgi:hypothetical protein
MVEGAVGTCFGVVISRVAAGGWERDRLARQWSKKE